MVLGHRCGVNVTVSAQDLAIVNNRVTSHFAFIGLTEVYSLFNLLSSLYISALIRLVMASLQEWGTSICLFHQMLGGRAREAEFVNFRAGRINRDKVFDPATCTLSFTFLLKRSTVNLVLTL